MIEVNDFEGIKVCVNPQSVTDFVYSKARRYSKSKVISYRKAQKLTKSENKFISAVGHLWKWFGCAEYSDSTFLEASVAVVYGNSYNYYWFKSNDAAKDAFDKLKDRYMKDV